jgi:23S rRNA (adenine1618-N6)-methyltransferase
MGDRILIHNSSSTGPLFPLDALGLDSIDFTMCNPPFYSSITSFNESAAQKALPPYSACTGAATEMIYFPRGELGFAQKMLAESLVLRTRVKWYSTLFGKLSSVSQFISALHEVPELAASVNWAVAEMVQGATKRWAVAWSFGDRRPSAAVAGNMKGCSPPIRPELEFVVPRPLGVVQLDVAVLLGELELMRSGQSECGSEIYGEVKRNVWSRAARRAMAKGAMVSTSTDEEVKLGFLITLADIGEGTTAVNVRWKRGFDGVLFESFCGMVKRKLQLEK